MTKLIYMCKMLRLFTSKMWTVLDYFTLKGVALVLVFSLNLEDSCGRIKFASSYFFLPYTSSLMCSKCRSSVPSLSLCPLSGDSCSSLACRFQPLSRSTSPCPHILLACSVGPGGLHSGIFHFLLLSPLNAPSHAYTIRLERQHIKPRYLFLLRLIIFSHL